MQDLLRAFISIFIAIDVIGIVPTFIALAGGLSEKARRRIILQSAVFALIVSEVFIVLGDSILDLFTITPDHFKVGGGLLLLVLSIRDLLSTEGFKRHTEDLGIVPLGIPLIVGPAVLTTALSLVPSVGHLWVSTAMILNILLTSVALLNANFLIRFLGKGGTTAVSKVFMIILSAYAVKMIVEGIKALFV
ncbi:MAG: MarC family protein [Thermotogae bacterium]|nr:MarC family protein [Thermotogota bacterium]